MSRPICETGLFDRDSGFSMDGVKPMSVRPVFGRVPEGMPGLALWNTQNPPKDYRVELPLSVEGGYDLDVWVDNTPKIHHHHLTIKATADALTNSIIHSFIKSADDGAARREVEASFAAVLPQLIVSPESLKLIRGESLYFERGEEIIRINASLTGAKRPDDFEGKWQKTNTPYRFNYLGPSFLFEYEEMKVPCRDERGNEVDIFLVSGFEVNSWNLSELNSQIKALIESDDITEKAIREIANPYMRIKIT